MNTLPSISLWLFTIAIFISVLFADFLPLPLSGYASQRFILVGLLSLCVCLGGAVWISRRGFVAWQKMLPVLLLASAFVLLALPFATIMDRHSLSPGHSLSPLEVLTRNSLVRRQRK